MPLTAQLVQDREEMKALWLALALSEQPPRPLQFAVWLDEYGRESLIRAFRVASRWLNRQPDSDAVATERIVKYTSKVMSNARADGLTEEEKEKELSMMRAAVGRLGARKRWQKAKQQVCHDLLAVATVCRRGSGSGSGSDSDSDSDSVSRAAKDSENEQRQEQSNPKVNSGGDVLTSTPTPTPKTPRLRKVIPRQEYEEKRTEKEISDSQQKTNRLVAEFKAELAAKPKPVFSEAETARMQKCPHISVTT